MLLITTKNLSCIITYTSIHQYTRILRHKRRRGTVLWYTAQPVVEDISMTSKFSYREQQK
jgi:hypothetical protein